MANVLVQESSLQAIAAAIRTQNGTQNVYTPAQMGPAILDISGQQVSYTETDNAYGGKTVTITVEGS